MADGVITFSTALDNGQLEKDLKKAESDIETIKRKIEKGEDDRSYLSEQLLKARDAARKARAEVERLQQGMGITNASDLTKGIKEATREVERLTKPLEEKTAQRTAIEEELSRANSAVEETKAKIRELMEQYEQFTARKKRLSAVPETGDTNFDTAISSARASAAKQADVARREAFDLKVALKEQESQQDAIREKWQALDAEVRGYEGDIEAANSSIAEMRGYVGTLQEAESALKRHETEQGQLERKWKTADEKVKEYQRDLERTRGRASELAAEAGKTAPAWQRAAEAVRSRFASVASGIKERLTSSANQSSTAFDNFGKRINSLLKRVFVFGVILKGLNAIKNAIGSVLTQNARFSASVENLKAVFRGFLTQIAGAVLPALTALVNTLAAVFERIAGIIDSLFGTGIVAGIRQQRQEASDAIRRSNAQKQAEYDEQVAAEQARYDKEVAKAQERQAKAARRLERAQERANRQIMGFDEINAMSAESAEEATEAMEDYFEGIEGPDFSPIEPPELQEDWTQNLVPDVGALQGVLDWLDELRNRLLNDVEGPFARIREGLQRIAEGWGKVVRGFKTGNLGLIWEGITDIIVGALYVIEGAFNALMDWLDEATGGRFHDIFDGLKAYVSGVADFLIGILTLDFPLALKGLEEMMEGFTQFASGVVDAIAGFVKEGVSWLFGYLSQRFPELSGVFQSTKDMVCGVIDAIASFWKAALDGMRQRMEGTLDIIVGILTLDGERIMQGIDEVANGIRTIVDGLAGAVSGILESLFGWIEAGISEAFDFLAAQFPGAAGLFEGLKQTILGILGVLKETILGVIDGVRAELDGAIDGARQVIEGGLQVIAGIFTRSGDTIIDGLRSMVNGFISILEGVLDGVVLGVVGFVNGIIDGLNNIPGADIPSITFTSVNLPRLAQGAVIPPNREFMAVLGDQKSGNNIETPEALMRQVVREEAGAMIAEAILALSSQREEAAGDVTMILQVGYDELSRAVEKGNAMRARRGELKPELAFG